MDKCRWKNYGLWVAIASFIPLILQGVGLDILPSNYTEIINSLLSILVMAGIVSNPTTSSKWFSDDKCIKESSEENLPK